jgi:hypothetical protein
MYMQGISMVIPFTKSANLNKNPQYYNRGKVAMAYSKFNLTEEWMGFWKTAFNPLKNEFLPNTM